MKIGIVTQPLSRNYGGILQNYALQQTLIKLGHTPYTFDLFDIWGYTWKDWAISIVKNIIKLLIGRPYYFLETPHNRQRSERLLRSFVEQNINLILPRDHRLNINKIEEYNLEAIIVGSDQVWRPLYNYDIEDLFLKFVQDLDIKRLAYAASFGTGQWEYSDIQTERCRQLAQKINAISVREDSAVSLCKNYLNVDAKHVLDPTLLLTHEEYNQLLDNIPKNSQKTLFAYLLDINEQTIEYIKSYAKLLGLEPIIKSAGAKLEPNDSIEKWLANFRDAQYVVTDSFHGCAFSIVYNVDFSVIGNTKRGLDRMTSLLNLVELKERLIDESVLETILHPKIDWHIINTRLNALREYSTLFLKQNL